MISLVNNSCISFSDPVFHQPSHPKLQVIALEECAPPPRPTHPPSTFYSDSDCSDSTTSTEEDVEDETCSSFCSSDDADPDATSVQYLDETFHARMRRILMWRDAMVAINSSPSDVPERCPSPCPQKRKADANECCSPQSPRKQSRSTYSLGALSCPACDADFTSTHGLRLHGRANSSANDACRVAVEYGLE